MTSKSINIVAKDPGVPGYKSQNKLWHKLSKRAREPDDVGRKVSEESKVVN